MYALAPEREPSRPLRKIITALLALVVLYYAGSWTLGVFGFGNSLHKETALLQTEGVDHYTSNNETKINKESDNNNTNQSFLCICPRKP
jgi:hypothetical protein